jgi:hypothetical protein
MGIEFLQPHAQVFGRDQVFPGRMFGNFALGNQLLQVGNRINLVSG